MNPLLAVAMPHLAGFGLVLAMLFLALGQVGDGAAPAAAAEPADNAGGEPVDGAAAGEKGDKAPPAEKKPRTIDDDLEDVLKKYGGYEYAKGKKLDSAANLKRMLGRVTGVDSAASEALKVKNSEAERTQKVAALAKMKPLERIEALKSMGFDPAVIKEAVYEDLLASDERAKAEAGMTERERQQARQLEQQEQELATHRTQAEQHEAAEKEQKFIAETERYHGQLLDAANGAFEKAGFPKGSPELVTAILPAIAERIERNLRLGLDLDHEELAEVAIQERAKLSNDWNAARPLEDLSASLEAIQTTEDDPHRPGQKMSRLRQLMLHEAAKLRAKVSGGQPAPARAAVQRTNGTSQSVADKIAAARTFGGGGR